MTSNTAIRRPEDRRWYVTSDDVAHDDMESAIFHIVETCEPELAPFKVREFGPATGDAAHVAHVRDIIERTVDVVRDIDAAGVADAALDALRFVPGGPVLETWEHTVRGVVSQVRRYGHDVPRKWLAALEER